jgi:hypothetical protein
MSFDNFQNQIRSRPTGITIIATLMILFSVVGICGSLTTIAGAPFAIFGEGLGAMFSSSFAGIVGLLLAIANIILAIGLFSLQKWAFWGTVIVEVLALINGGLFVVGRLGVPTLCFGYHLVPIVILLYLFLDSNVRRAFRV